VSGRGESATSPRRITAAEKRKLAFERRRDGLTFEQVAQSPIDPRGGDMRPLYPGKNGRQRAHEAVMTVMRELARDTEGLAREYRALELARLDKQRMALNAEAGPSRQVACPECGHTMWRETNVAAHVALLKLSERTSKYLGLDASDVTDQRLVQLYERQVNLAHEAMIAGMELAGIPADKQREVLEHAGAHLREVADAGTEED
jgi:hypothetical protein